MDSKEKNNASNGSVCSLKPTLDIYLTIEACSNIVCNLHISRFWLWFRLLVTFYFTAILAYSVYYWHYDGKLHYFMAFISNWILLIQFIYFVFASFITYKIYQQIQPKFERSHKNRVRHHVSQQWDVGIVLSNLNTPQTEIDVGSISSPKNVSVPPSSLQSQASYEFVGKPPDLHTLRLKTLFLFTKSLIELSLPYSLFVVISYWLTLYSGHFKDTLQAVYYINTHLVTFILQLIDGYASTYQLRFTYGTLWIIIFAFVWLLWMWLFEELQLVNPYTDKQQLYSTFDWHNDPTASAILFSVCILAVVLIYWFIVWTKNIALIRWKNARRAENQQLSADDADQYSSDEPQYEP